MSSHDDTENQNQVDLMGANIAHAYVDMGNQPGSARLVIPLDGSRLYKESVGKISFFPPARNHAGMLEAGYTIQPADADRIIPFKLAGDWITVWHSNIVIATPNNFWRLLNNTIPVTDWIPFGRRTQNIVAGYNTDPATPGVLNPQLFDHYEGDVPAQMRWCVPFDQLEVVGQNGLQFLFLYGKGRAKVDW